jgi:hypothetical protein
MVARPTVTPWLVPAMGPRGGVAALTAAATVLTPVPTTAAVLEPDTVPLLAMVTGLVTVKAPGLLLVRSMVKG